MNGQNGANKKVEISKKKYAKKKGERQKNKESLQNTIVPVVIVNKVKSEKIKEQKQEEKRNIPTVEVKIERSNSFFLTRKLSEIYQKLSGSKENLNKISDKDEKQTITRSLSLNAIQLKKSYRKSFVQESKLGKLSEEQICGNEKILILPVNTPSAENIEAKKSNILNRRSVPPDAFRNMNIPDFLQTVDSNTSTQQDLTIKNVQTKDPSKIKLERSPSLLSILRKKVSFVDKNQNKGNWNASLMNLQQIDNMVSYDNMNFVNYDTFNKYGRELERTMSQGEIILLNPANQSSSQIPSQKYLQISQQQSLIYETTTQNVKMREKKKKVGDMTSNLDRDKNLYRQSIDSAKLQFLSCINLETHRWSQYLKPNNALDYLQLENCGDNMDQV